MPSPSLLVLLAGFALTACTPAASVAPPPDHPATAAAPTGSPALSMAPLALASVPSVPVALQSPVATTDPHARHSTPMDHASMADPGVDAAPMREALHAYLALHDALASDDEATALAHAPHLAAAVAALVEAPPADDPHLWHRHDGDVTALLAAANRLGEASDLDAAREAFGFLSVPFARLAEVAGLPAGVEIERHRCGMARDLPEQGVWLQRPGPTRNPYFGAAMLACGTRTGAPGATPAADPHAGH